MRRVASGLAALLWAGGVFAGDKPEYGPVPAWVQSVQATAAQANAEQDVPTDSAVSILLTDWQFNFSTSTVEAYIAGRMRIQTPQGLAAVGTISLPWNPGTDTLTVHHLHIIRGDQIVDVLANGQTFTVLRRENSLEYAMLNGVLTAVIQPAGLQVGDIIDVAFSIRRSDPVLAGTSEWIAGGWPNLPISRLHVRATWTAPTRMRWKASDYLTGVQEHRHGDTTEVAVTLDNPAPLLPPNGAPPRYQIGRQIQFSSFASWAEVAARLAPLYEKAATLPPQSPLNAEVARIRAVSPEAAARAIAALRLVQDQVRYVFLGMNDGALIPADADLTWTRRFGDCKGKTALLIALLHALDIEAQPVLVNTLNGDSVSSALPTMAAFNHVLVRAVIDGRSYWLDGARSGDRSLDELTMPPYYWGLPVAARNAQLVQLVPTPLRHPLEDVTVRIDAHTGIPGTAPVHAETVLRGQTAALMRFALGNLAGPDRDQALRKYWAKVLESAELESVAAQFDEQSAQERITMDGSIHLEWSGGREELQGLASAFTYTADFTRLPGLHSDAPFAVAFPTYGRITETIVLPPASSPFTVDGDQDIERTIAGVEFRRHVHIVGDILSGEATFRSVATETPYAGIEKAKADLHELTAASIYLHAPTGYLAEQGKDSTAQTEVPTLFASVSPDVSAAGWDPAAPFIRQGRLYLNQKHYDQAIGEFDKALQVNPQAANALADRGMAHVWKRERDLARADLDKAFEIDSRNPVVPRGRGLLAVWDRNFAEATADFTRSLTLEPEDIFTLHWRAEAYRRSGDAEHALADNAEAIRLHPDAASEYVYRAMLLRLRGQAGEALQQAEAVTAANPQKAEAHVAAAEIYWAGGRDVDVMRSLEQALSLTPSAHTYVLRADYRPKADIAGRRQDLEAALERDARSTEALLTFAQLQSDAREYAAALATIDKVIALQGSTPYLLTLRGIVRARSGQTAAATREFTAALARTTEPEILNQICWVMAMAGVALDTALGACDAAVIKEPDDAAFLDSRGLVLLRLGRYQDAIAAYDAALAARPENGFSLYGRGVAKHRTGNAAAGDEDLKAALAMDAHLTTIFADWGVKP